METFTYDQIFEKLVKSAYAGNMAEEIQRLNPNNEERIANLIKYASGQGEKIRLSLRLVIVQKPVRKKIVLKALVR